MRWKRLLWNGMFRNGFDSFNKKLFMIRLLQALKQKGCLCKTPQKHANVIKKVCEMHNEMLRDEATWMWILSRFYRNFQRPIFAHPRALTREFIFNYFAPWKYLHACPKNYLLCKRTYSLEC